MRSIALLVFAAAVLPATMAASTTIKPPTNRDKQQAACYDDVNKFCKDELPDVDKVTACMKDKKSVVSAKCAAMWDAVD